MKNLKCTLEGLIFASGKPIGKKKLAKICDTDLKEVDKNLIDLNEEYRQSGRGIRLMLNSNEVQMVTAPEYAKIVEKLLTNELQEDLSNVSIETLTIIAYRGPMTRVEIESIRGVNCVYILRNLLLRGLITKQYPQKSHIMAYAVSTKFLRHLGVERVEDLPNYVEMKRRLNIDSEQIKTDKTDD